MVQWSPISYQQAILKIALGMHDCHLTFRVVLGILQEVSEDLWHQPYLNLRELITWVILMIGSVRMGGSLSDLHTKDYGCSFLGVILAFIVLVVIVVFWPSALAGQIIITGTPIDYVFSLIVIIAPIAVLVLMLRLFSENRESSHLDKELQF